LLVTRVIIFRQSWITPPVGTAHACQCRRLLQKNFESKLGNQLYGESILLDQDHGTSILSNKTEVKHFRKINIGNVIALRIINLPTLTLFVPAKESISERIGVMPIPM
jgi:hypothetical protein